MQHREHKTSPAAGHMEGAHSGSGLLTLILCAEIYDGLSPHAHVSSVVFVFCAAVHLSALNAGLTLNLNRHGAAG